MGLLFDKAFSFENLYFSYTRARKGKRHKVSICRFEANLLENLTFIHLSLKNQKYELSPYKQFYIKEPKERLIMYNGFKDKIVQHCLCNYALEPALSKALIHDNYASQKGKGTHFGLDRLKAFMSKHYREHGVEGWVLKCDIKKYFYSINHDILKGQLRKKIKDDKLLWIIDMIIDSTEGDVGIPIGNHTSQIFAIFYLSGMDHMIKEKLRIKMYGRYMDDFYLIHTDKNYLLFCLGEIKKYLTTLGLELNQKTAIFPVSQGIDFLGFRSFLTDNGKVIRKIRRRSKNNIKRKIKKFAKLLKKGEVSMEAILQSYASWTGHAAHGNNYHLVNRVDDLFFRCFERELEEINYGEITVRFARWQRSKINKHEV